LTVMAPSADLPVAVLGPEVAVGVPDGVLDGVPEEPSAGYPLASVGAGGADDTAPDVDEAAGDVDEASGGVDEAAGDVDEAATMMDDASDGEMVRVLVLVLCGGAAALGRASWPSVCGFVSMKAMVGPATS